MTFGIVVGCIVGVLLLIGSCLAFNIYRQRKLARRRNRTDREQQLSSFANATGIAEPMHGPLHFIPRYFPGTILPPPLYHPYDLRRLSPLPSSPHPHWRHEYAYGHADQPPPTPPPSENSEESAAPATPPGLDVIPAPVVLTDSRHTII
ncbi:hypothetical protein BV22DRAFT_655030 [Leucogyrophana mollusca]|uniref:Uncharacterized protein n=1 Tax=Leucogyrophana mollusca TaxID=85980 RepID=A0ACB8BB83_9AGAM|nr:hypothetical protein BV22DRAFT_655030 [Leucogyrophana mollusca]